MCVDRIIGAGAGAVAVQGNRSSTVHVTAVRGKMLCRVLETGRGAQCEKCNERVNTCFKDAN